MLKILLLTFTFLFGTAAKACMITYFVLMGELQPADANKQTVAAKVELLIDNGKSARVRVIEAMKGVEVGDQFDVEVNSPCMDLMLRSRYQFQDEPNYFIGGKYFIAGNWKNPESKKVFIGGRNATWTPSLGADTPAIYKIAP